MPPCANPHLESRLDALEREVRCPICLDALVEPQQLAVCKHLFCRSCLERTLRELKKDECPVCNQPASRRSARADPFTEELANSIQDACKRLREGESFFLAQPAPAESFLQSAHGTSKAATMAARKHAAYIERARGGDSDGALRGQPMALAEILALNAQIEQKADAIAAANRFILDTAVARPASTLGVAESPTVIGAAFVVSEEEPLVTDCGVNAVANCPQSCQRSVQMEAKALESASRASGSLAADAPVDGADGICEPAAASPSYHPSLDSRERNSRGPCTRGCLSAAMTSREGDLQRTSHVRTPNSGDEHVQRRASSRRASIASSSSDKPTAPEQPAAAEPIRSERPVISGASATIASALTPSSARASEVCTSAQGTAAGEISQKQEWKAAADDGACCICGDEDDDDGDVIVFCDGCNIAVHQKSPAGYDEYFIY